MRALHETTVEQLMAPVESKERIYKFLKTHPVGVLSTVDEDGNPRATVIYYSVSKGFIITFVTRTRTRKHQNLQQNARMMLVAYDPEDQITVQINGSAYPIEEPNDLRQAFRDMIKNSYITSKPGSPPPITKLDAGEYAAYQVIPSEIRLAMFTRPDPGGYDMFETIYFTP